MGKWERHHHDIPEAVVFILGALPPFPERAPTTRHTILSDLLRDLNKTPAFTGVFFLISGNPLEPPKISMRKHLWDCSLMIPYQ